MVYINNMNKGTKERPVFFTKDAATVTRRKTAIWAWDEPTEDVSEAGAATIRSSISDYYIVSVKQHKDNYDMLDEYAAQHKLRQSAGAGCFTRYNVSVYTTHTSRIDEQSSGVADRVMWSPRCKAQLDILKQFWTFWNNRLTRDWTFWNNFGHFETPCKWVIGRFETILDILKQYRNLLLKVRGTFLWFLCCLYAVCMLFLFDYVRN